MATNPARGKRRRLKAERPRRTWLELDEIRDLLDAAGEHRPLLANVRSRVLAGAIARANTKRTQAGLPPIVVTA